MDSRAWGCRPRWWRIARRFRIGRTKSNGWIPFPAQSLTRGSCATASQMTLLFPGLLAISVFVASFALTGWFRREALAHLLLDVPNSRSSHTIATPRGGGVAIVLSALVALLALGWRGWLASA